MSESKLISFKDIEEIEDSIMQKNIAAKIKGGVKKTRITIKDGESGEVLGVYENKVVISGSALAASKVFGVEPPFKIPNYNSALSLENSVPEGTDPDNEPIVCLFCIGDSGCGEKDSDVITPKYTDRISPENDIIPFRFVDSNLDITSSERDIYFGRKIFIDENKIGYYFKAFDNDPQMFLRYTDGTEITPQSIFSKETSQDAECFMQIDLTINRLDFRDYFDYVGWDKARISTLSLVSAWYTEEEGYKWYQDIIPFTKLNFSYERLVDNTKSLSFEYALFF